MPGKRSRFYFLRVLLLLLIIPVLGYLIVIGPDINTLASIWNSKEPIDYSVSVSELPHSVQKPFSDYSFDRLDRHALAAPDNLKRHPQKLVEYLIEPTDNDLEKVRVIYRWITDNIEYDTEAFFNGTQTEKSAGSVLTEGKAVCNGYSKTFEYLAKFAQLEVVSISGYGKGYGYKQGDSVDTMNHDWNAVKIDGKWYLLDTTWASGATRPNRIWNKRLDDSYFLTPPAIMALSHLPIDDQWQLLESPISKEDFQKFPDIKPTLFELGFDVEEAYTEIKSNPEQPFPKIFGFANTIDLRILEAPISGVLNSNERYHFKIYSESILDAAIVVNGNFYKLKPDSENPSIRSITVTAKKGDLGLYVVPSKSEATSSFSGVMKYSVL